MVVGANIDHSHLASGSTDYLAVKASTTTRSEAIALKATRSRSVEFLVDSLLQKNLDQRLVRHVAFVCQQTDLIQHRFGQTQRYGLGQRLELREDHGFGLTPINIVKRGIIAPASALTLEPVQSQQAIVHPWSPPPSSDRRPPAN